MTRGSAGIRVLQTSPFTCPKAGNSPFLRELVIPFGSSGYRLAKDIGVPLTRIDDVVAGMRFWDVDAGGMQQTYDRSSSLAESLGAIHGGHLFVFANSHPGSS